uniref:CBM6 domain-containing protein n=1 Tax=uncultured bacterium contig00100(2014) TaxID=1465627 RepID=A0A060CSJ4_9BACT|nr:hypothetical protein [uncultured bacterium contig00100(2014)]
MRKIFLCVLAISIFSGCSSENPPTPPTPPDNGVELTQDPQDDVYKQKKSAKRGISTNFKITNMPDLLGPGVSWAYDWGDAYSELRWEALRRNKIAYAPMGWNNVPNGKIAEHAKAGAEYLLGFNEPNLADQANISPAEAAKRWQGMLKLASDTGLKLVSPAMCWGTSKFDGVDYGNPVKWFDAWLAQDGVSLDQFDAIAGHTYMPNTSGVKGFVRMFAKYNKPFWLTEFCHANNTISTDRNLQMAFMSEILTYLEADPQIGKYSWFMDTGYGNGGNSELIDWQGKMTPSLNPLGVLYVHASSLDKETHYNMNENIPAEHYSDSSATASASAAEGWKPSVLPYVTSDAKGTLEIHFGTDCWVEYLVDIPADGEYRFDIRYAAPRKLEMNFTSAAGETAVAFEPTGNNKTWATAGVPVTLKAGKQTVRLSYKSGIARINWIRVTSKQ